MAELGVTDEQFVEACQKASQNPIHKKIVDQIMAVDNFLAFKRLMVKRNAELNVQAEAMMSKTDPKTIAKDHSPSKIGSQDGLTDKERKEIQEAYRIAQEIERQEEEEMIRKAIEESERLEQQQKS